MNFANSSSPLPFLADVSNISSAKVTFSVNARSNRRNAGFTDEERDKMTELLAGGFLDTFRTLYPDRKDAYTWWSYMGQARAKNTGWRIDYFIVSKRLGERIEDATIHPDVFGSDHCPVGFILK